VPGESITRNYVNVASDSIFWHKQYEGGQKGTEAFCPKFMLGNGRVLRLRNEKQKLQHMGKVIRLYFKGKKYDRINYWQLWCAHLFCTGPTLYQ